MKKFRQINEAFEYVIKGTDKADRLARLKECGSGNQLIVPIFRMGVGAEKYDFGVPEGVPETVKFDKDIPEGMGQTTMTLEWRRIRQFFTPGSNLKNLPAWKQEANWLQILEGLHMSEAKILTHIKDGTLLKDWPDFEPLLKDLGITEYNKPVPVTKKKTVRKKKAASK